MRTFIYNTKQAAIQHRSQTLLTFVITRRPFSWAVVPEGWSVRISLATLCQADC